jgi:hypothetical protein
MDIWKAITKSDRRRFWIIIMPVVVAIGLYAGWTVLQSRDAVQTADRLIKTQKLN